MILHEAATSSRAPETFLAKGKRGEVFLATLAGKTVVIKRALLTGDAAARASVTLDSEERFLKTLNAHGIGPKLLGRTPTRDGIVMEYIKGERILEFFAHASKQEIRDVCLQVIEQCRTLDTLKINKKELTNPYKHIIVRKRTSTKSSKNSALEVIMLDFERCMHTLKPKNVTQFLQFLSSGLVAHAIAQAMETTKGKVDLFPVLRSRELALAYKSDRSDKTYGAICTFISTGK